MCKGESINKLIIEEDGPDVILTKFGWSVVGKIPLFLVSAPNKKRSFNI